jgi:hypothetical protein
MVTLLWISLAHGAPLTVGTLAGEPLEAERPVPIVGGVLSSPGDWPMLVALHTDVGFACTGIQIDDAWVLTAGHCAPGLREAQIGATDAGDPNDGVFVEVAEVTVHEAFLDTYDVAAVRLATPVESPPFSIALDCDAEHVLREDEAAILVGYGATDALGERTDRTLHEAPTRVVDHDCAALERGCNAAVSPGGEFIAGGDGADTCTGDSGGPAFVEGIDGLWLVGITSRAALPADVTCGDGGIFVRLDAIASWLEGLDVPLIYPNCDGSNRTPQPTHLSLIVEAGGSVSVEIQAHDPNLDDQHTITLSHPPGMGSVRTTPSGGLRYHAPQAKVGTTSFRLDVTDDGFPPLTGTAQVDVTVIEPLDDEAGCVGGTRSWLWLWPLLVWRRRTS